MTNKAKATHIIATIMEELNMPAGSTIGDVARALLVIDPEGEIMKLLTPVIRNAVIDDIKSKIA